MRWRAVVLAISLSCLGTSRVARCDSLPFNHKVEVYREKDSDVIVFLVRLEQPFLAEEFEKSNYLRLHALDQSAYLIYPRETKFRQKHAEFYGRLRGQGKTKVRLSYETVSENPDGSRRLDLHHGDIEIAIPTAPGGPPSIFPEWAKQQNAHFLNLLNYYPDESFFQYILLQSGSRYGVDTPPLVKAAPDRSTVEADLYDVLTGSLAIQELLQQQTLGGRGRVGDLNIHISELSLPRLQSIDYAKLLEEKRTRDKIDPKVHDSARLVPEDQYFLHFHSMKSAGELFDLTRDWGDSLLRLFTIHAQDNRVEEKFDEQLCLRRDGLTQLFAEGTISEFAITGSDPYVLEGTDVTFLFRLKKPDAFRKAADEWLAQTRQKHPDTQERAFNYRGHKVVARYTNDRLLSSFVSTHDDYVIYSNSHAAIRKIIDAATGKAPSLANALDYRYITTILPPAAAANAGYLYASEAFVKRLVGPEAKVAEKRRVQCFNNLVMLNNASLFYRLEYGKSPASLNDLIQGRFVDPAKIVCPHGGAYAYDSKGDTCTCSLHNRLKYLTPNVELPVLKVASEEKEEYERYKTRYQAFWGTVFDPLAVRLTVGPRVQLEVCVLPFANGSLYNDLRAWVDAKPQTFETQRIVPSAVASLMAVHGRKNVAHFLRGLPGIPEALRADPTLTDLSWLGDRIGLHLCDNDTILEIDPTKLHDLTVPLLGKVTFSQQAMVAALLAVTRLPAYLTIEVEDRDKAARLLEQLSAKIFLQKGNLLGLPTTLDAYRLPDYRKHPMYVLTYQIHALKIRLHVALVDNQLVAATKPQIVREIIDAASNPKSQEAIRAHVLLRLNQRALNRLTNDVQFYWEEKARQACHRNTISVFNLLTLYDVPIQEVPRLAEAKYGVRYFCPDHGVYGWNNKADEVVCSVHGNRQHSRQETGLDRRSSFAEFLQSLDEVVAALRFQEDALIATIQIVRRPPASR
jgi:hypothetical protein